MLGILWEVALFEGDCNSEDETEALEIVSLCLVSSHALWIVLAVEEEHQMAWELFSCPAMFCTVLGFCKQEA